MTCQAGPFTITLGCGACPDSVIATCATMVRPQLEFVQALKKLALQLNALEANIDPGVGADIADALTKVPTIPAPNLMELTKFFTCPLTPLVVALDPSQFTNLDPRAALSQCRKMYGEEFRVHKNNYERCLASSVHAKMIGTLRFIINEIMRLEFDPIAFAKAVIITATIKVTCGYDSKSVFGRFESETLNWSIGPGMLPSDIGPVVLSLLIPLMASEIAFDQLQAAITEPIPLPSLPDLPLDFLPI